MTVRFEPFSVGVDPPLETAQGLIRERDGFLLTVSYEGTNGVGEATPLPGWTESYRECQDALSDATRLGNELDWGVALSGLGETEFPAARHGLSLGFADAHARTREEPLYRLLADHTNVVSRVPVNATIGAGGTPETVANEARDAVNAGFQALKLKVGTRDIADDIERIRAAGKATDDVELRVDANGAWSPTEADRVVEACAALGVSYIEQPLPPGALTETAALRGRGVDIALDESLAVYDVETVFEMDAADVFVLKPMVLGGPDYTAEIARQCRQVGIDPVITTTVDAVVARVGAVHVAASVPNVRPCGLATGNSIVRDLAPDPTSVADGTITVPQSPGLGFGEAL